MGLFPVGLGISRSTQEETQAAIVARSIFHHLRDPLGGARAGQRAIQIAGDPTNAASYIFLPFQRTSTNPQVIYLAYSNVNSGGASLLRPVQSSAIGNNTNAASAPSWYARGQAGQVLMAQVIVRPILAVTSAAGITQRVDVMVESPGNAPWTNREQFFFSGVIH
jgi:hypothetical protein